MTINEMKTKYFKLKKLEHKLIATSSNPMLDPKTVEQKTETLKTQIEKLKNELSKIKNLEVLDLKESVNKYFKQKNIDGDIETKTYDPDYDDSVLYVYLNLYNSKYYLLVQRTLPSSFDIYKKDYAVNGILILDKLLSNSENMVSLRKQFPDITDCVWNAYANSLKRKIDDAITKQEEAKSLVQRMIAKLKAPTHIANEINKLQKKVDKINKEVNKLKGNVFNIDLE